MSDILNDKYKEKYFKYKIKYLDLKNQEFNRNPMDQGKYLELKKQIEGGQIYNVELISDFELVDNNNMIGGGTHRENFLKKHNLEDKGYSLKELSKISKVPLSILREVYDRGSGAYKSNRTSVRLKGSYKKNVDAPYKMKLSKEQWAMARTYSFLDGNPKHDNDLRKKIKK